MINKEKLINELKSLYKQNQNFLDCIANGTTKKKYRNSTILEFSNLNKCLSEHIQELENGSDNYRDFSIWCGNFCNILMQEFNDDNSPIGGDL